MASRPVNQTGGRALQAQCCSVGRVAGSLGRGSGELKHGDPGEPGGHWLLKKCRGC